MQQQAVEWVLDAFEAMGATVEALAHEREKLESDWRYLAVWASATNFPFKEASHG